MSEIDDLHKRMNIKDSLLWKPNNVNFLLSIFSCEELLSIVKQIVKFGAIYFVKGNIYSKMLEAGLLNDYNSLNRGEKYLFK